MSPTPGRFWWFLPSLLVPLMAGPAWGSAFSFHAGAGYDFFTKSRYYGERPSGWSVGTSLGFGVDDWNTIQAEYLLHSWEYNSPGFGEEWVNSYFDLMWRHRLTGLDQGFRAYVGAGPVAMYSSRRVRVSDGFVTHIHRDAGMGYGAKAIVGAEVGSSSSMFYLEVGYRTLFASPFDDEGASAFTSIPVSVGFRGRY